MKERHLRGLDPRDIEEFGFDDDDDLSRNSCRLRSMT